MALALVLLEFLRSLEAQRAAVVGTCVCARVGARRCRLLKMPAGGARGLWPSLARTRLHRGQVSREVRHLLGCRRHAGGRAVLRRAELQTVQVPRDGWGSKGK